MGRPINDGKGRLGGRQKGTPNKSTLSLIERCQKLNCDPFDVLVNITKGDWAALGYKTDVISFESRLTAAKELMQYLYPKRKAIELTRETEKPMDENLTEKVKNVSAIMKAASERKGGGNARSS